MTDTRFQPDSARAMLELADYLDFLEQEIIGTDIDLKLPENLISPGIWADRIRARIPDVAVAAREPLGPCTQAEIDAWIETIDRKNSRLLLMWMDRALKAEEALAALPPEAIGREWQSIETAPKDGTWILTCCATWSSIPTALRWDEYRWWDDADEPEYGKAVEWQPTHWMPLPDGPVVSRPHHSSPTYECENCIGMIEHGCYCQAMGAVAPGGPLPSDRDTEDARS